MSTLGLTCVLLGFIVLADLPFPLYENALVDYALESKDP
jgi:hypothetical protein